MPERPTYPKSTCCIPGCPRWSRKFPGEWLCARRWRMIPRGGRAVLNRAWKRWDAAYSAYEARQEKRPWQSAMRAERSAQRLWARAKRYVILREAGH